MPKTRQCYEKHQGACFCPEAPKYRKIVRGYTAQARFYARYMAQPDDTWKQLGWMRAYNGAVKPVFQLLNGTPVMIFDGSDHLTIIVQEISTVDLKATEDECYAKTGAVL